jgi:multimeric flavodoxin WrbA
MPLSEGGGARYVYAISASPRRGGNTEILLETVTERLDEAGFEVVVEEVGRRPVNPCLGCNRCGVTGECVQDDRMQSIYPRLAGAEAVILAAPVFSMHLCAQAKALIDRCQRFWSLKYVLGRHVVEDEEMRSGRRGLYIGACGRDAPSTFDSLRPTLAYFYHVLEVPEWRTLQFAGVDEAGAVRQRAGALEEAAESGAWLIRELRSR